MWNPEFISNQDWNSSVGSAGAQWRYDRRDTGRQENAEITILKPSFLDVFPLETIGEIKTNVRLKLCDRGDDICEGNLPRDSVVMKKYAGQKTAQL